jgi:rod shape-determining protein MreD
MSMKKILILIPVFYILALFQTSFLIHFNIFLGGDFFGWILNLVLIAVILITVFENPEKSTGIFSAFIGGFFLDIFSENFIGFHVLILLTLVFLIKFIFKKYVRTPLIR